MIGFDILPKSYENSDLGLNLLIRLRTRIYGDLSGVISLDLGKSICLIWVTMSELLRLFPSRSVTI